MRIIYKSLYFLQLIYGIVAEELNEKEHCLSEQHVEDIWRLNSKDNLAYIRSFMAANSKCTPTYGPIPEHLHLPTEKFYLPVCNIIVKHINPVITGLKKAKIIKFSVDSQTGSVLIAVNIQNYNFTCDKTWLTVYKKAKWPASYCDWNFYTVESMTLTAVIPKVCNMLRLDLADVYADIDAEEPTYAIGPNIEPKTPDESAVFEAINKNWFTVVKESTTFQSHFLLKYYIQKYLCDFGLEAYTNNFGCMAFRNKGCK